MLLFHRLLFFTLWTFGYIKGYYGLLINITLESQDNVKILIQNKPTKIYFNCSYDFDGNYELYIHISNPNIVTVKSNLSFRLTKQDHQIQFFVTLEGLEIGYADISFKINNLNSNGSYNVTTYPQYFKVGIIRTNKLIDTIFTIILSILLAINLGILGTTIDLKIIEANVKKPIAPIIGFLTQFLFMPLLAFGFAVTLFQDYYSQVGIFTIGCSPGGGASNLWTLLIGGDVTLSVTMTFISILAAFGMMPLWIFTLGNHIFHQTFKIPYLNMLIIASGLIIPVGLGILIQILKPNWKNKAKKCVKWSTVVVLIVVSTLGVYTNLYIFPFFTFQNILRSLSLPCAGFLLGAIAAKICQRSLKEIIAISIETGLQNAALAYVLLKYSLPQPAADLSVAMTIVVMADTSFVLFIVYLLKIIWKFLCKHKRKSKQEYEKTEMLLM